MTPCVLSALAAAAAMLNTPSQPDTLDPLADPLAVVIAGNARFTVLTPAMIRMEWSADGAFEDRPSVVFVNRRLPVPAFETVREDGWVTIRTAELTLRYCERGFQTREGIPAEEGARKDSRTRTPDGEGEASAEPSTKPPKPTSPRFDAESLSVDFTLNGKRGTWKPGMPDTGNLRGTTRTLDGVSGGEDLEPGLLSRDGWTLIDDSTQLALARQFYGAQASEMTGQVLLHERTWPTVRPKEAIDWYFLGYGHDYARALKEFTRVAGRIPLPPRFVFGAWWSRYWPYSDAELRDLVEQFHQHDVPLDVLVIDMDWHLDGWTGYTWNPKCFPDPDGFLKWVKAQGLRTTLNLHPADGVGKHEAAFADVARHMGLDPAKVDKVPFDCADPAYMDAYFKYLHHPLERQGVDFWWIDWQQGATSKIEGLDPLRWLNHLHWHDMERRAVNTLRRPLIMSRWPGLGGHRYPIGFSGDTYCNWESLAFQPYFTSTAGNVGFAYWSHDVGGHMPGVVDPELYVRWIQWGVFNPTLRTHTTRNENAERRIWAFPEEYFDAAREAFLLRYSLIPYIYTAARQGYDTGLPLCRPLYYAWPEADEAYTHGGQYLFGDDLMVAPVTSPRSPVSGCAEMRIWIPPGEWVSWATGRTYRGPAEITTLVPLEEIPVFARAGAIIPAMPKMSRSNEKAVDPLILHIWPGQSGRTRVYGDDGQTIGYQHGDCAWTPVEYRREGEKHVVTIAPVEGAFPGMLKERRYEVQLHDVWSAIKITINGEELRPALEGADPGWRYDTSQLCLIIPTQPRATGSKTEIVVMPLPNLPDEMALRDGLRGKCALLSSIEGFVVGPHDMLTLREDPRDADFAFVSARAHALVDWVNDAASAANRQFEGELVPGSLALKYAARLLGASARMTFAAEKPPDEQAARITVRIHAAAGLPLKCDGRVDCDITIRPTAHWSPLGDAKATARDHRADDSLALTSVLKPKGEPRTDLIGADIMFRNREIEITLPIEQVILPSIDKWWIIGPFLDPAGKGLDAVFPPEREIDLRATYPASAPATNRADTSPGAHSGLKEGTEAPAAAGKLRHEGTKANPQSAIRSPQSNSVLSWLRDARTLAPGDDPTAEFYVDLRKLLGESQSGAVAYGLAFLHAEEATEASLALGSDDGVIVWLNGKEVHRNTAPRAYLSKQDRAKVKLNAGVNTLLVKVGQVGGGWGFAVHVESPDGRPLPQITTRFDK